MRMLKFGIFTDGGIILMGKPNKGKPWLDAGMMLGIVLRGF